MQQAAAFFEQCEALVARYELTGECISSDIWVASGTRWTWLTQLSAPTKALADAWLTSDTHAAELFFRTIPNHMRAANRYCLVNAGFVDAVVFSRAARADDRIEAAVLAACDEGWLDDGANENPYAVHMEYLLCEVPAGLRENLAGTERLMSQDIWQFTHDQLVVPMVSAGVIPLLRPQKI